MTEPRISDLSRIHLTLHAADITDEQASAAALTVCAHAKSLDDAKILLSMLGLIDSSIGHSLLPASDETNKTRRRRRWEELPKPKKKQHGTREEVGDIEA
jgi:hypothetical protein